MPQRSAFDRARQYVWYRPWSPTVSILLAPLSGLLLVLLLCLLSLLLDLAMTRGLVRDGTVLQGWVATQGSSPEALSLSKLALTGQGLGLQSLAIRTHQITLGVVLQYLVDTFPALQNNYVYLLTLTVGILLCAILFSVVSYFQKSTAASAAIDGITRLRRAVHTHAYRLSSMTLTQVSQGPVIGSTMRALDTVQDGLFGWFVRTVHEPCNLLWLLVFLFCIDSLHGIPWTSLMLLAAAGLYWLFSSWITASARYQERKSTLRAAEGQALLLESLGMHRLVKMFSMEHYGKNRLERLLHRQGKAVQLRWYWQFFSRHGRWFLLAILGTALALALVGNLLSGDLRFIPVIMMLMTVGCLLIVLKRWQQAWLLVRKAKPAARGLFQLLDQETDVKQVVGAELLSPMTQQLVLNKVTVLAPGTDEVLLDEVSLTIPAGEHVALVGDEQARLTIAYLIPRLIDPDQGDVRIDDKALPWVTLESIRKQVGVVLQNDLIFNDTVANNISCGNEEYTLPRIIEAAKLAHAHHFIMKLPDAYETRIGDLGDSLTVSERFRIALARVILRDPTIMIVEEPISGLTDEDKVWFDDTLSRFLHGRTAILLPHRLSTIRKADRVVLLHKGAIIDHGSDADMIRRNERYKHWQYLRFHSFQDEV